MAVRRNQLKVRRTRQQQNQAANFGNFSDWAARVALEEPPRCASDSEDGAVPTPADLSLQRKWVVRILSLLLVVLMFGNLFVWVVLRWGIDPAFHNGNTEKMFRAIDPLEESYEHVAEAVVPSMKTWYRAHATQQA
eukprot:2754484-Rhodomonas_salina.1